MSNPIELYTDSEISTWAAQHAMVERACGVNQLAAGNGAGAWRIKRADMLRLVAMRLKHGRAAQQDCWIPLVIE